MSKQGHAATGARVIGRPFSPGQSGNPAGRARGSRNRVSDAFVYDLAEDFAHHGRRVIERVRQERPAEYLRVVAALMPRRFEQQGGGVFDGVDDPEMRTMVETIRQALSLP